MRDRDLVRLYWPVDLRPAFDALFGIDDALAEVVASSTQPALGAIRLAWWREALVRLDHGPPPPEPRLMAVAEHLLPRGISGQQVARLEDGWASVLDEAPASDRIAARGEILFAVGAALLGANDPLLASAGRAYAWVDSARRGFMPVSTTASETLDALIGHRFARKLRPLTALTRLASRDVRHGAPFEPEATPGRAAALIGHWLFGTI